MSEELRPCPFCGRSDTMCFSNNHEECDDDIDVPTMYIVVCSMHDGGCGAHSGYYETKLEAAAAWNRRVERTCRPVVADDGAGAWGVYCSECGYRFAGPYGKREVPEHMAGRRDIMPRYCQSCGARVEVDE